MATPNSYDFLAWFLGPKAENGKFLEGLIGDIVRDYAHWRKNYFPDDPILLTQQLRSKREESQAVLEGRLAELLAALRRNFPFYSPRYIAHELSETLMPAVLGYIAGILYNPNNVTPEAAPVSTELEIEVTSEILEMLGYHAPPPLPAADVDPVAYYTERGRSEFGWAHLTSGGTIANIEALWVARQIKYFPLSVKELAIAQGLDICVKLPNERTGSIRDIDDYDLLLLRPNECIYLLPKLVAELARTGQITHPPSFMADTWKLLENGRYATSKGFGPAFGDYPPKVLVATSAHYSIAKAANILGIGQSNIIPIKMDSHFRLDVDHLRRVLVDEVYANRHVPLCVIAAAGSTEEGVVDPIHSIIDLRADLEKSHGLSFWTHIDAAWGGYIRSLFRLDEFDQTEAVCGYASKFLRIPRPNISPTVGNEELRIWHGQLTDFLLKRISEVDESLRPVRSNEKAAVGAPDNFQFLESIQSDLAKMLDVLRAGDYRGYRRALKRLLLRFAGRRIDGKAVDYIPEIKTWLERVNEDGSNLFTITDWLRDFVGEKITVDRPMQINWPSNEVAMAFLAFPKAESITIDPHKMGYAPYPAGCVAFRNDLIRSFILQEAPYVTSAERNTALHVPPRYVKLDADGNRRVVTESFSPFILEGSRPGAAATGLWLAMKCVPYNPRGHGAIVRSTLLSARLLHELLIKSDALSAKPPGAHAVFFVPLLEYGPDTNIVTFTVSSKAFTSLAAMNELTTLVYDTFSIHAELGERAHSYSQPFFLSKTTMNSSHYSSAMLERFFARAGLSNSAGLEYRSEGMVVLRATMMNPYLSPARNLVGQDFCRLFMTELIHAADIGLQKLVAA
ncbi:MAG: pyridoxal-dependent decarboxylase [Rhizomicrobium sp.]